MIRLELILVILIVVLQYSLWFGKNSVKELLLIKDFIKKKDYVINNVKMRARNDALFAEINDLYNGYEAVEERSRSNLGMIKKGEIYYRIIVDHS